MYKKLDKKNKKFPRKKETESQERKKNIKKLTRKKRKRNPTKEKISVKKFTRRKRKRGIWFHFSFLESPRFSLPTKEKISVYRLKHMYKKVYKKNKNENRGSK